MKYGTFEDARFTSQPFDRATAKKLIDQNTWIFDMHYVPIRVTFLR